MSAPPYPSLEEQLRILRNEDYALRTFIPQDTPPQAAPARHHDRTRDRPPGHDERHSHE